MLKYIMYVYNYCSVQLITIDPDELHFSYEIVQL